MKVAAGHLRKTSGTMGALALLGLSVLTGCQVDVSGQTLPSPYWLSDDVQYFAPGTEFKLAREAAAMQAAGGEGAAGAGTNVPVAPPGANPPPPAAGPIPAPAAPVVP